MSADAKATGPATPTSSARGGARERGTPRARFAGSGRSAGTRSHSQSLRAKRSNLQRRARLLRRGACPERSDRVPRNDKLSPLPRVFFARNTLAVAKDLLGRFLVHETPRGRLIGRIVEVEAYRGPKDPASHAYRRTPRSQIMWGRPGMAYVYFTYGNHYCLNVVTEPEGIAGAVLLRAIEPLEGIEAMRRARGIHDDRLLTSGPGRLTQAMAIGRNHNGLDLTRPPLYLARGPTNSAVAASPRIGIRAAADRMWRFYIPGNLYVSRRVNDEP